jgi:hydroxymethylglutaryl-CoA lyase
MILPAQVKIREVVLRDGLQSWPIIVPTAKKIEIFRNLVEAGVKEMETTSFVSPGGIPQLADAELLTKKLPKGYCRQLVLVPNLKGANRAYQAGADNFVVFISASEEHNKANLGHSISRSLYDLENISNFAARHSIHINGSIVVAFGCPFSGDVPEEHVFRLAKTYILSGVESITLGDTTGMATPTRVERLVKGFKDRFPDIELSLHFHNNRGTAMANVYAGLLSGCTVFDTSLGGIGGCPNVPQASGNLATEDLICMLNDMEIDTGLDLMKLIKSANALQDYLGRTLPGQVMKSGPRTST